MKLYGKYLSDKEVKPNEHVHNKRLIATLRKIVLSIRTIERHVNGTSTNETSTPSGVIPKESLDSFRKSLDTKCPIPLDLLDLLDVGAIFGMNPQLYARELMKESARQLGGLERRKRGLTMLAEAIESGMNKGSNADDGGKVVDFKVKEKEADGDLAVKTESHDNMSNDVSNKRKRDDDLDEPEHVAKKERVDVETK